jgi:hypothetical protein
VRESFESLRDKFTENQVITFRNAGHSIYDGITGYFFQDEGGALLAFDVVDDVSEKDFAQSVRDKFEPIALS